MTSYLHQLHEVFKEHLVINCELAIVVDDVVVLHLSFAADAQRVVARKVGALAHQEQARLRRVEQVLRLVPSYLPMKPPGRREDPKFIPEIQRQCSTGFHVFKQAHSIFLHRHQMQLVVIVCKVFQKIC